MAESNSSTKKYKEAGIKMNLRQHKPFLGFYFVISFLTVIVGYLVFTTIVSDGFSEKVEKLPFSVVEIESKIKDLKRQRKMPDVVKSWDFITKYSVINNVSLEYISPNEVGNTVFYKGDKFSMHGKLISDNALSLLTVAYYANKNIPILFYGIENKEGTFQLNFSVLGVNNA